MEEILLCLIYQLNPQKKNQKKLQQKLREKKALQNGQPPPITQQTITTRDRPQIQPMKKTMVSHG